MITDEAGKVLKPWEVRAGMVIVETRYSHRDQAVVCVARHQHRSPSVVAIEGGAKNYG